MGGDENKIYMYPTLSSFFEDYDIKPDRRMRMIISIKGHLHVLADEISYFSNLPDILFAFAGSPFRVEVGDVSKTAQERFINLLTAVQ